MAAEAWTEEQLTVLRERYSELGVRGVALLIGRSNGAVRNKAYDLKIKCGTKSAERLRADAEHSKRMTGRKRPDQSLVIKALWDQGKLGVYTPEKRAALSERAKRWIAENGHPRGALGMTHSLDTRLKLSAASRKRWRELSDEMKSAHRAKIIGTKLERRNLIQERHGVTWRGGWREVGGVSRYFRSRWEANYARFLQWLVERGEVSSWTHEDEAFMFEGETSSLACYVPDFRVNMPDGSVEYHEVKGWMDERSRQKLALMTKHHPDVVLKLIDGPAYNELERKHEAVIEGWEPKGPKRKRAVRRRK